MYEACIAAQPEADLIIKAAAVGDFKTESKSSEKIKRAKDEPLTIKFIQNRDIAAELGKRKKSGQMLVGFAAETQDMIENAKKKIASKNLDMIAVNDVLAEGAGFGCETNTLTLISADGSKTEISGTKDDAADALLDAVLSNKSKN
jgi:phosphopantothenoylcysteine decarboxylase/phosphopantothenate--cysteine ligase